MKPDPSILAPDVFKRTYPCIRRPLVHARILWALALCGSQYVMARKVSALIDASTAKVKMCLRHLVAFSLAERRRMSNGMYSYRLKPELLDSLERCPWCGSPARPIWHKRNSRDAPREWVCLRCRYTFEPKTRRGRETTRKLNAEDREESVEMCNQTGGED